MHEEYRFCLCGKNAVSEWTVRFWFQESSKRRVNSRKPEGFGKIMND